MTAATAPVAPSATQPARAFRSDIQGLRAIAVLLVLAYHAGIPAVAGGFVGVDVFFVISGFLITGLILRELERTGKLNLPKFYARRIRRLLPATAVIFIAVTALTILVLPVSRWREIAGDLVASAVYLMNWHLADRSVDYLAAEGAPSPLQHFWSLAVEEQFYVIWPLLLVAVLTPWRGRATQPRLFIALAAVAVPSFVLSITLTVSDPGAAYFVTTTRTWEMAIGAFLALFAAPLGQLPRALRRILGWLGLIAIGYAALTFDASTAFPGSAALVPTLGAAAVLISGTGDGSAELRPLTGPVMQRLGDWSYSTYLWHWPLLVGASASWAPPDGSLWLPLAIAVSAFSIVPAWLTFMFVERPFHRSQRLGIPRNALKLAGVCVGVGVVGAGFIAMQLRGPAEPITAIGAAALGTSPSQVAVDMAKPAQIVPDLASAYDDVADVYEDGCHQNQRDGEVLSCAYGDVDSDVVIALVGDSHAAHWQPALRKAAEDEGWRVETYTKSGCLFGDTTVWNGTSKSAYVSCYAWQSAVLDTLIEQQPDLVVTSTSHTYRTVVDDEPRSVDESRPSVVQALASNWAALEEAGVEVLTIVDTPRLRGDVPDCVAAQQDSLANCARPVAEALADSAADLQMEAAAQAPQIDVVDFSDYFCPRGTCMPVIGNVLTFTDAHHMSATYARSLAPSVATTIEATLPHG